MSCKSTESLKYIDETDKCYGLAGMAISLMVWDAEEQLHAIDLDAEADRAMVMAPEFYLCMSQAQSPKSAWQARLQRFQIEAAMLVGNVACRQMAHRLLSSVGAEADRQMRAFLQEEAGELCQLEADEATNIYTKAMNYCSRLFSHPGVCEVAKSLAEAIAKRRQLSQSEAFEILAPLSRL
jgi:hypothetical protein